MYAVAIEFDRTRTGETRRQRRVWTFSRKEDAELEASHFSLLAQAGSVQFLRNGDKLTFQECRLYSLESDDPQVAKSQFESGDAQLLKHAFNPAIKDPGYWETVLAKLDHDEPLD